MLTVSLDDLESNNKLVDVLCITEHNMKSEDVDQFIIPNFNIISYYARKNRNGGSCILVRNIHKCIAVPEISTLSVSNIIECSAIELIDHRIFIVCVYRVPKCDLLSLELFYDKLNKILTRLCYKTNKKLILCGDFNINILQRAKNVISFEQLLQSYGLKLQIRQPTRIMSGTCIDNIAHNTRGCKAEIIELALSDHTAQLLKCPIKKTCSLKYWFIYTRDYCKENLDKFRNCLSALTFNETLCADNANNAYDIFHDTFKLFYDLCFPTIKVKILATKKPLWITQGIKLCSKRKRELLWKSRKSPSVTNKSEFKQYSKRYKRIIKLTQKSRNDFKIKTSRDKSRATWNIINNNTKHNFPKNSISQIKQNGKILNNPEDIARAFNDYFIDTVKPTKNNQVPQISNNQNLKYNPNSIFIKPCIAEDIIQIIRTLRNSKSTGVDGITTKVIKYVGSIISLPLSHIINLCISSGIYPNKLKTSIIKPIFKKEDRENMQFYRPVALIPIFSKIIEKIIYKNFYDFFESYNIIVKEQYGFRKKKTINMAVFDFLYKIYDKLDKSFPIAALYMDMTRAFDYVDHNVLLNKLYVYGIRGIALELVESYLRDRLQITHIARINATLKQELIYASNSRVVKYGVPQGSVLGPLLFIIYINDLPSIINFPMVLFADDSTALFCDSKKDALENDINNSLSNIINWLQSNNLLINLNKSKIMNFRIRQSQHKSLDINYLGTKLDEVENTRFLGLSIDNKLTWQTQIDMVCKKINKYSYALHMLRKVVSRSAVLTAYHAFVASTLRYGIIFWGNATDRDMVFKAQKRCIRAICNLRQTDSCRPYFQELQILTVPSMYIFEISKFVKTNPHNFEIRNNLRIGNKMQVVVTKTAFLYNSVVGMAPKIFNKLPRHIRDTQCIDKFKDALYKLLMAKTYYSIKDFINDKTV